MTLADLDKLIRLEAFLSDEPESRHEFIVSELSNMSDVELRELVKEKIAVLRAIDPSHRSE